MHGSININKCLTGLHNVNKMHVCKILVRGAGGGIFSGDSSILKNIN